jgi:hypothetical protein
MSLLLSSGAFGSGDFVIRGEQSRSLLSEVPVESKPTLSALDEYLSQEAQAELRAMLFEIDKLLVDSEATSAEVTGEIKTQSKKTQDSNPGEHP